MCFFLILLFAHIIGDFPLQTDSIYRLKQKSFWGVLVHVGVCTLVNITILYPFLTSLNTWLAIVFLAVFHIVLDKTKIFVSILRARDGIGYFFLDQGLHIFSLWGAAVFLSYTIDINHFHIANFYADNDLIIKLTSILVAAFASSPVIFYIQKHFMKNNDISFPTFYMRLPSTFARLISTLCVIFGGWYLFLVTISFIPFFLALHASNSLLYKWIESTGNVIMSLICGIAALLLTN